jgi:hypothetical protein
MKEFHLVKVNHYFYTKLYLNYCFWIAEGEPSMDVIRSNFNPLVNGFKFVNYFQVPSSISLNVPFIHLNSISLPNIVYGLCGGMCYSALDYYHAGKSIPGDSTIPISGSPIYQYLLARQLNSLDHGTIEKVMLWMLMEDEDLDEKMAQTEIPALRASLDGGNPAVLVLIRVKGLNDPSHNHQVMAVGYDFDSGTNAMMIYLYDPNHPGEEPSLSLNLSNPAAGLNLTQSTGEPLRGFFVGNYQAVTPS